MQNSKSKFAAESSHKLRKSQSNNHTYREDVNANSRALTPVQSKKHRAHQANNHTITGPDQNDAYRQTLAQIRKELPRSKRPFSVFIHISTIEKLSDILANTIFRPNAILAGGVLAFLLVLAEYSYAKYAGFAMRGSETIIAFVLGWILGCLFDIVARLFRGNKR